MKKIALLIFLLGVFQIGCEKPPCTDSSHLILHLTQTPKNEAQHRQWNNHLHALVDDVNKELCSTKSGWDKFKSDLKGVFRKSPKPCFFYARFDYHFGVVTLSVPQTIDMNKAITTIYQIAKRRGLPIEVGRDCPVTIATRDSDIGLEGFALSLDELEKIKKGGHLTSHNLPASQEKIEEALFWYQQLPTVGLRHDDRFTPPPYPFIPHCFDLWELAPSKGKGIKIAIIDTGVAAFPVKGSKQYLKNYDLEMKGNFNRKTYNIVSDDGLDPVEQFIHKLKYYLDEDAFDHEHLEKVAPQWIKECLEYNTSQGLATYMQTHGRSFGRKELQKIERAIKKTFNVIQLDKPYGEKVIEQFVPLVQITDEKSTFVAGHGSHGFGVVGGQLSDAKAMTPQTDIGICGLAPSADIIMIKAFDNNGISSKSTLIAGLKKAISFKADIVNLSLKIADKINLNDSSTQSLDRLLGLIPYVVTASGNGKGGEAFPARFETVNFDVGAFRYKNDSYPIISFSQYTKDVGPRFVAPGYNILSCGLVPSQTKDSMYAFMSGTSMAAPIMSGFIALVLAEFNNEFDSEQIQKVIYKSAIKMHDDNDWHNKTLLGVVDMRTALLILHTLRNIRENIKDRSIDYDFDAHFDNILQATHYLLYSIPHDFSKKHLDNVSIENNYAKFLSKARSFKENESEQGDYTIITMVLKNENNKLKTALQFLTDSLLSSLHRSYIPRGICAETPIIDQMSNILKQNDINLFSSLSATAQKRLLQRAPVESYWKVRAHKLQQLSELT